MNLFTIYGEDILSGGGDSIAVYCGSGGGCSDNGAKVFLDISVLKVA